MLPAVSRSIGCEPRPGNCRPSRVAIPGIVGVTNAAATALSSLVPLKEATFGSDGTFVEDERKICKDPPARVTNLVTEVFARSGR